ncbi:S8 family serine peptidase [Tenuifilum thalassicum]|uniref:S8 family serine peptidase n=1 Tax=Tenuifilum thalassicum TaxID=2590900 RepID=A0A7D4BKZ1_9BACT|nr:S8 family serine peptidase [Tenuifilum thalassicum]QKG80579.1 S8 family serine peptidase [Tenuifilum thalassicum]
MMEQRFIKTTLLLIIFQCAFSPLLGQTKYFIAFTDKQNNLYSLDNPEKFLSSRAIERRTTQNIPITEEDLPVSNTYIEQLASLTTTIHYPLKWFNGVVATVDPNNIASIQDLPFVKSITKIYEPVKSQKQINTDWKTASEVLQTKKQSTSLNYGISFNQIAMHNGHLFHNNGYLGEGITIAILDAGFLNVNTHYAFDSLWANQQILGTRDFVDPSSNIFAEHYHGAMVLSTIGGYADGMLIGTAPKANFWLIRTEDANTEQLIEEYNWAAGAELADSAGVDIINSSLGYTEFDVQEQSHTYQDLDGQTTPITLAANIAASKGMVVVVSAGNEGSKPWHYISAPADSPNVLTVGAVDANKTIASFSSRGPTADGRIKPDVCAMGVNSVVAANDGSIGTNNGTSFSAPIMAGLVACFWQSNPSLTAKKIVEKVKDISSRYSAPDNTYGYGIPDFAQTLTFSQEYDFSEVKVWPNPFFNEINISLPGPAFNGKISIYNSLGTKIFSKSFQKYDNNYITIKISNEAPKGLYIIKVINGKHQLTTKCMKY